MYDVIVVGARTAGSPTAMLFARQGYRVLLLERSHFPRDVLSGLYIHQPGIAKLARWGLLDEVVATGCPALERTIYHVADVCLDGCSGAAEGIRAAYAPRRTVLDPILAKAAAAAGVEVREGVTVLDVLFDDGRAVGVRLRSQSGGESEERARLVVGADGMHSTVAKKVDADFTTLTPSMTCVFYAYWGVSSTAVELYEAPNRWLVANPTHDGATLVGVTWPQAEFDRVRKDPEAEYAKALRELAPALTERLAKGGKIDRVRGTGDQPNFFRQAAGPGWALVGDAGHHKDPITARGITDAFFSAELLVDCIGEGLHDEEALLAALQQYAEQRDFLLSDFYESTLSAAELVLRPERLEMLRTIAASPEATELYFSATSGVASVADLATFLPEEGGAAPASADAPA